MKLKVQHWASGDPTLSQRPDYVDLPSPCLGAFYPACLLPGSSPLTTLGCQVVSRTCPDLRVIALPHSLLQEFWHKKVKKKKQTNQTRNHLYILWKENIFVNSYSFIIMWYVDSLNNSK